MNGEEWVSNKAEAGFIMVFISKNVFTFIFIIELNLTSSFSKGLWAQILALEQ